MVSLSIDLSGYVGDLAKPFATQLHANDDSTRESAVKCVASLALKCSDSEAILTLLKSIFAVLNGSEGKLTVADHKISLLTAVAALADNSILGKCFLGICIMYRGPHNLLILGLRKKCITQNTDTKIPNT